MLVPHQSPARPSESPHTGLVGFSFRLCVLAFHSMFRTAGIYACFVHFRPHSRYALPISVT